MKKKGFTLIELLVVIAIIAILAAILFPVFAKARESARRSSCMSNLKQLGLGVTQYTQDYDERFPTNSNWVDPTTATPGTSAGWGWAPEIFPYVKSAAVYRCPDDSDWYTWQHESYGSMFDTWYDGHYFSPDNGGYDDGAGMNNLNASLNGGSLSGVQHPADKGMMFDQEGWHQEKDSTSEGAPGYRDWVFVDGHAKYVMMSQYAPLPYILGQFTGVNEAVH